MHRVIVAACLAVTPWIALGASIYKVQMPDGTILFTDSPPAAGKVLEERAAPGSARPTPAPVGGAAGTPAAAAPPIRVLPSRGSAAPAPGSTMRPLKANNLDAANTEITAAERELSVARRKLEVGREPLPGERLGTAKGGSRLSPEYESRVADLEREVSRAESRVKSAYDARNELK